MNQESEHCLLSVITLNYNGVKDTCELLESLPIDDPAIEVIVVDNASIEDEATVIGQRFPQVTVIRSDRNLGFAGGNNLGIEAAHGKYLFFINNDTFFKGEDKRAALQPLIDRMESSEKIGMVSPKIRFSWDDCPIQFAGYTPLSPITMRNSAIGYGETDHGQYDTAHPTPYAHGAAMMVRREAIERAGVMPQLYFLYYEELDWSEMIRRANYDIWYEPACTVYHKESRTTGRDSARRTYYITRNRLLFVRRNGSGFKQKLSYVYLAGAVALKDIVKYIFTGRFGHMKATIRGVGHFINYSICPIGT
jgi:GT2 family glycosyltransferase